MNILAELRRRFTLALSKFVDDPAPYAEMVRPSQDPKFGDYQANFAMPLARILGKPSRDVAAEIAAATELDGLTHPAEIAGPGFINLRVRDEVLARLLAQAERDTERRGLERVASPRTYILDYSSPNVAKPMHVGHIRSTVIGDALYRTLKFLGHNVVSDNHVGDWGTQFGMIIYGWKNFSKRPEINAESPGELVAELSRLYRLVNQLVEYHASVAELPKVETQRRTAEEALAAHKLLTPTAGDKQAAKKHSARTGELDKQIKGLKEDREGLERKIEIVRSNPELFRLAGEHPQIGSAVLAETAKLHSGDAENVGLWKKFLPACLAENEKMYRRLGVTFDETLGESFYHDRLEGVVQGLLQAGIAQQSDGATVVFDERWPAPMIVRKQDGAFLYATSDLATIQYRIERWRPDAMLYVVDHRQSLHFTQLFDTARRWGCERVEFQHIAFGTVLGKDGRPYKTRGGDTVGLTGLLDEAVERAYKVVSDQSREQAVGELGEQERRDIAQIVGIGALKYADLSQNRTSDYEFSYDKMLAMNGNTATYMQYAYARVQSIFRRGDVDLNALRANPPAVSLATEPERALGLALLRFPEALDAVLLDYRPSQLTSYLFELASVYSTFFQECPVLKAETPELRASRLVLCDLTARTVKLGLALLGIEVAERM